MHRHKYNKEGRDMKNKNKGFTLSELRVVVAIIGILAAVGTVAYTGYTSGAKKNSAKSNHAAVLKYIAAETQKCSMDSAAVAFNDTDICAATLTGTGVAEAAIAALSDFKNPYRNAEAAVADSFSASKEGTVRVVGEDTGNTVTISTCLSPDCVEATPLIPAVVADDGTVTSEAIPAVEGVDFSANLVVIE